MAKITDEVLNEIRARAKELQRAPMKAEMKQKRSYYGGWNHAVTLAGLCPYDGHRRDEIRPPMNGKEYTNSELLSFVRQAAKNNIAPQKRDVPEYPFIEYRFGPWAKLMKKMGYRYLREEQSDPRPSWVHTIQRSRDERLA
ncbi:MAG: hypothetical protein U0M15_04270 [Bacillota bacterium]|nr:hypothetical protein [Bacillota bacterium]